MTDAQVQVMEEADPEFFNDSMLPWFTATVLLVFLLIFLTGYILKLLKDQMSSAASKKAAAAK